MRQSVLRLLVSFCLHFCLPLDPVLLGFSRKVDLPESFELQPLCLFFLNISQSLQKLSSFIISKLLQTDSLSLLLLLDSDESLSLTLFEQRDIFLELFELFKSLLDEKLSLTLFFFIFFSSSNFLLLFDLFELNSFRLLLLLLEPILFKDLIIICLIFLFLLSEAKFDFFEVVFELLQLLFVNLDFIEHFLLSLRSCSLLCCPVLSLPFFLLVISSLLSSVGLLQLPYSLFPIHLSLAVLFIFEFKLLFTCIVSLLYSGLLCLCFRKPLQPEPFSFIPCLLQPLLSFFIIHCSSDSIFFSL